MSENRERRRLYFPLPRHYTQSQATQQRECFYENTTIQHTQVWHDWEALYISNEQVGECIDRVERIQSLRIELLVSRGLLIHSFLAAATQPQRIVLVFLAELGRNRKDNSQHLLTTLCTSSWLACRLWQ